MSFQAYLDNLEKKTGRTPAELLDEARDRGITSASKAQEVVDWLASDYEVGRGHAMALYKVIKDGATISDKHVGGTGTHRDPSNQLRLDGLANR